MKSEKTNKEMFKMRNENKRLTEEQRELVNNNIGLVKKFIEKNRLKYDDRYDLICIALCEAAITFNPEKGKFSTHAFWKMQQKLTNEATNMNRNKRGNNDKPMRLDQTVRVENEDYTLAELVASEDNVEESAMLRRNMADMMKRLTQTEQIIAAELAKGATQKEIGNKMGLSQQAINAYIKVMRSRLQGFRSAFN